MEKTLDRFCNWLQVKTEAALTRRKAVRTAKKNKKRTFVGEILDWLDAIVFAVVVVLLVNQFLFQFFVVPSGSMEDTLLIKDRVVVSKFTYGTELFPYGPKIRDARTPDRDDIITFYNPQFKAENPFFAIFSKLLYMGTFSLVNIDVDEEGNPNESLLVKRAAGLAGDTVTFRNGNAYIRLAGTSEYVDEASYRENNGYVTSPKRTLSSTVYNTYNAYGRLVGYQEAGMDPNNMPAHLVNLQKNIAGAGNFTDYYEFEKRVAEGQRLADPANAEARSNWMRHTIGLYVPEGCVMPLGDNRDNSGDGRYFGPVSTDLVNGFVTGIFWPLNRVTGLLDK